MKVINKPLPFLMLMVSIVLIFTIILQLFIWNTQTSLLIILCTACSLLFTLSLAFNKDCHLYNPLFFIFMIIFVGVTLRGYYMVYYPNNEDVRYLFLGIHNISYFVLPAFILLFAFIFFMIGFKLKNKPYRFRRLKLFSFDFNWNRKRLQKLLILFSFISFIGIFLFIKTLGISSALADISAKRYLQADDSTYRISLGYYRFMAGFIEPAFYIYLLYFLIQKKRIFSFSGFILLLIGLFNLVFPVFTSSRSGFMFFSLNVVIILALTKKLSFQLLTIISLGGLILFSIVTILRSSTEVEADQLSLIDPIIFNRNLLDFSVTSNIIEEVPDKMPYEYGQSFLTLFTAPVPRALWHDKPTMMMGYDISHKIYGFSEANTSGIPPGFIGELYVNFGLTGIFIGMLLTGIFIKKLYLYFNFKREFNKNKIILYVTIVMNITILLFGDSFNQAVLGFLQTYIPVYLALKYVSMKKIKLLSKYNAQRIAIN